MEQGGGSPQIQIGGQLSAPDGVGEGGLQISKEVAGLAADMFAQGDGFPLQRFEIEQDGEHLLVGLIPGDTGQHLFEEVTQLAEGVWLLFIDAGVELMGEGLAELLPEGEEELLLVFEVPVDGPARQVSGSGDVGQAGLGQPLAAEEIQRRLHDGAAGLLCLLFGPSGHLLLRPLISKKSHLHTFMNVCILPHLSDFYQQGPRGPDCSLTGKGSGVSCINIFLLVR